MDIMQDLIETWGNHLTVSVPWGYEPFKAPYLEVWTTEYGDPDEWIYCALSDWYLPRVEAYSSVWKRIPKDSYKGRG